MTTLIVLGSLFGAAAMILLGGIMVASGKYKNREAEDREQEAYLKSLKN